MAVSCYSTLDISASSNMAHTLESYEGLTWPMYNLPSLHYTYSRRVIGIINSLKQSNCSPNGLIFVKAMNTATNRHVAHYEIGTRI